ncbi:aldose epimerase family protein [Mucilaginibacter sp. FT3.2]|uniref:aldose epimerase family protein n=1 Tax=Mucilaginibacter sp. FT3.2 TaxID=2723090 RepID=UPI001619D092|nr:aldose epimerase family protein [Mucilaginibacter sp. FT3.2]MBB6232090.1 aldose 1-epimerase [Mucilaginibacter sp. FT3.2]
MINSQINVSCQPWGEHFGCPVYLFRIENTSGAYVELTNYGATLVSVVVPDAQNNFENVVLGYSSLAAYIADECYLGATIGRFANRIAGARFTLDNIDYHLDANDGASSNHGGGNGFNSRVFGYSITDNCLLFTLQSDDNDGGFPGKLNLTVAYSWSENNELNISYRATTDKKTVANFTNHAYFNLSAKGVGIFDHSIKVYADALLDVDAAYVPTGLIKPAGNKALTGENLRDKMVADGDRASGFNDCFVLKNDSDNNLKTAAILAEKASGRTLTVLTTYPAIIVYTGDYLDCTPPGNFLRPYKPFDGLCLECQYYPDSPNHAHFPSTVLSPGDGYNETIVYKFGVVR